MRTTTYTFGDGKSVDFDAGPWWRRAGSKVADFRHVGWDVGVRLLERKAGHKRGDRLDYRLRASARDLLAEKGQVVRDDLDALRTAIARSGAYAASEEATRALHAVLDALRDRVPPDLLLRLTEYLPEVEAKRVRAELEHLRRRHPLTTLEPGAPDPTTPASL